MKPRDANLLAPSGLSGSMLARFSARGAMVAQETSSGLDPSDQELVGVWDLASSELLSSFLGV